MKRAEQILSDFLKQHHLTIAFAESITCGLLVHKMGTISDTSEILKGSIVCYDESVKITLLQVSKKLIEKHTAESQQVTDKLAVNLSKIIKADVYAAVTGLAAAGGSETKSKPVGTVFYSVCFRKKIFRMRSKFNGSPMEIKEKACEQLFKFITAGLKSTVKG